MGEPVIIAAAVVGAEVKREQNPAVPYTGGLRTLSGDGFALLYGHG